VAAVFRVRPDGRRQGAPPVGSGDLAHRGRRRFCQDAGVTAVLAALASTALAALIAVAAYAGSIPLLAVAVGVTVLFLALGWGALLELPAPRGTALIVMVIGGASAGLAVWATGALRPLAPFAALLALAVLLSFGHELIRGRGRPHLVESLTGTLSGAAVALLGGGWVLLPGTRLALAGLAAGAAAVAGARLGTLLPVPPRLDGWVSLATGAAAGAATGAALDPARVLPLVAVVVAVASVVAGLDRLLLGRTGRRSLPAVLSASAAPVLAVGTVAYAVARLVA
jgi:hypothetical protein